MFKLVIKWIPQPLSSLVFKQNLIDSAFHQYSLSSTVPKYYLYADRVQERGRLSWSSTIGLIELILGAQLIYFCYSKYGSLQ
jgi:hypothetical protein